MQLPQLGLVSAIALGLNLAPLLLPIDPATRAVLAPAEAQTAAVEPFTLNGRLDSSSQVLQDGSYFNPHTFEGTAGQTIRIELVSQAFDTYLILQDPQGDKIAENDDGSNGSNAELTVTLPATGTYTILANSYGAKATGEYSLSLQATTAAEIGLAEAQRLIDQGAQQFNTSRYRDALQSWQQALEIYQQETARAEFPQQSQKGEANALNNLGVAYLSLSQYQQAIEYYQQALAIYLAVEDQNGEANALMNLGNAYLSLSQYQQAVEYYQQALLSFQAADDRTGEANALGNLGVAYLLLSQYQQAIEYYRQALPIHQAVGNRNGEAYVLNNLGNAYRSLSLYQQAIEYFQQALPIYRAVEDRNGEATALSNLGSAYLSLSQHQRAVEYYQQTLPIFQEVEDREGEAGTLMGLGGAYLSMSQYQQAIEYFQQALLIYQTVENQNGEATALMNLGVAYKSLSQYQQAIEYYRQALPIHQTVGDRNGEADVLANLGSAYSSLSQYQQAIEYFQQSLPIYRTVEDREGQGRTLANIGKLLKRQSQPELAIVFLKQSVNVRESIRGDIRNLSKELQQSYTDSVADDYRQLADLLLAQGRILEAQQVLDLLKLEELREFTRNARSFETDQSIALNAAEDRILAEHDTLINFGQKIIDCERSNCPELNSLLNQRRDLANAYDQRISVLIQTIRDNRQNDQFFYDPTYINESARAIVAEPGTVLIYPFVQDDKLWLIWTAAGDIVGSKVFEVNQQQLGETVIRFRELLQDPRSDLAQLQSSGKQLYDWLIAPIEAELKAKGQPITHLVFAQDRILRYVPMAALFDGNQYLIQRYQVSTILSAELTDMSDRLNPGTSGNQVLALGLSDAVNGLNPLPNVETELDQIVRLEGNDPNGIYPGGVVA